MLVYSASHIEITFNPDKKQLIQTWTDFTPSDIFREAIHKTVDFIEENVVYSIISDTTKQRAVKLDDSDYAASIMPVLFANGLKAMAFVIPENIFTKMALKKFAEIEKTNSNIQYFTSIGEAMAWIDSITQ